MDPSQFHNNILVKFRDHSVDKEIKTCVKCNSCIYIKYWSWCILKKDDQKIDICDSCAMKILQDQKK